MDIITKIGFGIIIAVVGFCKLLSKYAAVKEDSPYKPIGHRTSIIYTPSKEFRITDTQKYTDTNTPNQ